jgi:hypothetical protein
MNMLVVLLAAAAGLGAFLIIRELCPAPPALRPALARFTNPAVAPASMRDRATLRLAALGGATPLARRVPRQDLALLGQAPGSFLARQTAYGITGLAVPVLAWMVLQPPLPWAALPIMTVISAAVLIATPVLQIRREAARAREDFREALIAYLDLVALARTAGAAPAGALEIPVRICRGWAFTRLAHALDPARRGTASTWGRTQRDRRHPRRPRPVDARVPARRRARPRQVAHRDHDHPDDRRRSRVRDPARLPGADPHDRRLMTMFEYLAVLLWRARDKLRGDDGAITLEWIVIAALLFVIALAAVLFYTAVVRKYMSRIG